MFVALLSSKVFDKHGSIFSVLSLSSEIFSSTQFTKMVIDTMIGIIKVLNFFLKKLLFIKNHLSKTKYPIMGYFYYTIMG